MSPAPRLDAAERSLVGGFETRFAPGQSGNPRGRPPKRIHLPSMLQDKLDEPCKSDVALAQKQGRAVRTNLEVITDLLNKVAIKELQRMLKDADPKKSTQRLGDITAALKVIETAFGRAPKEVVHSGSVEHAGVITHEHKVPQLVAEMRGKLERIREADETRRQKALAAAPAALPETTE